MARIRILLVAVLAITAGGALALATYNFTQKPGRTVTIPTRPVIVAITTEGPEMSDRVYQSVLEPLRASGATFHVLIVGTPRNNNHDRAVVLDMGTKDSGGRYDTIMTSNALATRMKQIATDLTHQYRVTYARPDSLIPPEHVTIGPAKPGLTVRGTPMKVVRDR